jgi:poly-gamma-glutamate synthesis protein (capsule biosynthesis protein)
VGESLTEAREAGFIDTARGRVALISCASSFLDFSRASTTRGDMPARPGLSPLRFSTTYVVTRDKLEALRQISNDIGRRVPESGDELTFFNQRFVVGDEPAVRTKPHPGDLEAIRAVVNNAERLADYVFVTIHAHNQSEYLRTFAHAMIDAGADLFVGHGPHEMHGIEIYKGKPIFYSMGSFITQYETQLRFPADDYERHPELDLNSGVADYYDVRLETLAKQRGFHLPDEQWEGAIAIPRWVGKDLQAIELHPITLGAGLPRWIRGRPMLADPELSKKVITDLQRLSEPYGTQIEYQDGIGLIRLSR